VCTVWDARPALEASSEVQLVLLLQCLSRRFQQVLRAHPLQLRLDFSITQLAERHLAWLALPAWKDHVTSLTLYNWLAPACEARSRNFLDPGLCAENDVVSPLLAVLHANQRGSLRQLLGMPLRLGGVTEPRPDNSGMTNEEYIATLHFTPLVDLHAFHLTHLGVSCGFCDSIEVDVLPQTIISLIYRPALREANVSFSQSTAAVSADVVVCGGSPVVDLTRSQALDGWHANIEGDRVAIHISSAGLHPHLPSSTFTDIGEVRIDARYITVCNSTCAGEEISGLEALLDLLFPPCLERVDIVSGSDYPNVWLKEQRDEPDWRLVMRKMIDAYGSQFAFEIDDRLQKRVLWRRWPAPGTQEHDAACRLHAEAAHWAAA